MLTRYVEKLSVAGGAVRLLDPYQISEWKNNVKLWPEVQYGDIYNYLVNTPGQFTHEQMKNYKSLDGYLWYIGNKVQPVFYYKLEQVSMCFLKALVVPSQSLNSDCHETWVLVKDNGGVVAAHCRCMAGLGETCSHVAALLFKVEAAVKLGLTKESSTSALCAWNNSFQKKVDPKPLAEIQFIRPVYGKRVPETAIRPTKRQRHETHEFDEEKALSDLREIFPSAAILTKTDSDTDTADEDDEELPPLMIRFHEELYSSLSESELQQKCKMFLENSKPTTTQRQNLEALTKGQADTPLWHRHREGRITGTVAHNILTLQPTTSPEGVLETVMKYKQSDITQIPAVRYGLINENKARVDYHKDMCENHTNFKCEKSGLILDNSYFLFAASPDGLVSCDCHGEGILEVKCSFSHRNQHPDTICGQKGFYLDSCGKLIHTHRYYTQVQFNMYVANRTYCDFVVYTDKGIKISRVDLNLKFLDKLVKKCLGFSKDYLIPEIFCRNLALERENSDRTYCLCKRPIFGKMLRCASDTCPDILFHYECVGLKRLPREKWYCASCRQI